MYRRKKGWKYYVKRVVLLGTMLSLLVLPSLLAESEPALPDSMDSTTDISGRVWLDENDNSLMDEAEPGLADMTVNLYSDDGTHIASVQSDTDGWYQFTDLDMGRYRLAVTWQGDMQDMYEVSAKGIFGDNRFVVSSHFPHAATQVIVLSADEVHDDLHAALVRKNVAAVSNAPVPAAAGMDYTVNLASVNATYVQSFPGLSFTADSLMNILTFGPEAADHNYTITGTTTTCRIVVATDTDIAITMTACNLSPTFTFPTSIVTGFPAIWVEEDTALTLNISGTNTIAPHATGDRAQGVTCIYVPPFATLVLQGDGTLNARSAAYYSGIIGGNYVAYHKSTGIPSALSGNISVRGITLNIEQRAYTQATSNMYSAAIGGCYYAGDPPEYRARICIEDGAKVTTNMLSQSLNISIGYFMGAVDTAGDYLSQSLDIDISHASLNLKGAYGGIGWIWSSTGASVDKNNCNISIRNANIISKSDGTSRHHGIYATGNSQNPAQLVITDSQITISDNPLNVAVGVGGTGTITVDGDSEINATTVGGAAIGGDISHYMDDIHISLLGNTKITARINITAGNIDGLGQRDASPAIGTWDPDDCTIEIADTVTIDAMTKSTIYPAISARSITGTGKIVNLQMQDAPLSNSFDTTLRRYLAGDSINYDTITVPPQYRGIAFATGSKAITYNFHAYNGNTPLGQLVLVQTLSGNITSHTSEVPHLVKVSQTFDVIVQYRDLAGNSLGVANGSPFSAVQGSGFTVPADSISDYQPVYYLVGSDTTQHLYTGNDQVTITAATTIYVYYASTVIEMSFPEEMLFYAYPSDGGAVTSADFTVTNNSDFPLRVDFLKMETTASQLDGINVTDTPSASGDLSLSLYPKTGVTDNGFTAGTGTLVPNPIGPTAVTLGTLGGNLSDSTIPKSGVLSVGGQYTGSFPAVPKRPQVKFVFQVELVT